jgi:NADH-quinone oxidoreductase subunit A
VEIVFLFPWAVVLRDLSPPLIGLLEAVVFVLLLLLGLVYVWKKGGLEWE